MKRRTHLDEMQRETLFRIEETAAWLAFWGLLAAIIIQLLLGQAFECVLGEVCVFALTSGYLALATLKNGLWAASVAPGRKANALISLAPAGIIGALSAVKAFVLSRNALSGALARQLVLTMAATYAGCFLLLEVMRAIQGKRRGRLDEGDD